jgi:hypothetical protein
VYCDNEQLRNLILDAKPSPGGLYPHELAMVFYTSIGQIQYENPRFAGVFSYQLKVEYPICLLYSLVERGYIRKSVFSENIKFYGTREMQRFVKERGAKTSTRREALAEIIRSTFSESEIRSRFPQDYFVPTEKGMTELSTLNYTITDAYKGWEDNKGYGSIKRIGPDDISICSPKVTEISITTDGNEWLYTFEIAGRHSAIEARVIRLPERSNLVLRKDGRKIFSANDVDIVRILRRRKLLVFESICDTGGKQENNRRLDVVATGYDSALETCVYVECLNDYAIEGGQNTPQEFFQENVKRYGQTIFHDGKIDYYASVNDQIAYLLLHSYLDNQKHQIQVADVSNFLEQDATHNIKITVPEDDADSRNLIHYLVSQRLLMPPTVCGTKFSEIAMYLYLQNSMGAGESNTRRYYLEDELGYCLNCKGLIDKIKSCGEINAFLAYFWNFPLQVFHSDPYRYYDSSNGYCNDANWAYVKSHESFMRAKYNTLLLEMKAMGLIPTRWISELNLYFSIHSYFSDALYQYRCDWLGQQSLDIYIPSKRVGIEYQGKQHYEAVAYFGGEDALAETQKRDQRKKQLCSENNVRLLTWHYSTEVTPDTVYEFLIASGISQPKELTRKTELIPVAKKKQETKTKGHRMRGKIYCYDKQFAMIGIYQSIGEASQAMDIGKTSIDKALRGERLLAGDHFWYRGDAPLENIPEQWKKRMKGLE